MKKKHHQFNSFSDLMVILEKMLFIDQNSISNQLIFATKHLRICKLIEWCSKQEKSCFKNPDLKIFSELGFISTHSIYVRGLAFGNQPNEISLNQIVEILQTNADLINRKNYLNIDNIPYTYETELQDEIKHLETLEPFECITSAPSTAEKSKKRHEKFDVLSNTAFKERQETDKICIHFFNTIRDELQKCENTNTFANFCVAHRQLEDIRKNKEIKNNQKMQLQIENLEKNYVFLWKVFNTLNYYFFDSNTDPILNMNYQFALIQEPMVELSKLQEYKNLMKNIEEKDKAIYKQILSFTNS